MHLCYLFAPEAAIYKTYSASSPFSNTQQRQHLSPSAVCPLVPDRVTYTNSPSKHPRPTRHPDITNQLLLSFSLLLAAKDHLSIKTTAVLTLFIVLSG